MKRYIEGEERTQVTLLTFTTAGPENKPFRRSKYCLKRRQLKGNLNGPEIQDDRTMQTRMQCVFTQSLATAMGAHSDGL